ncbi:unknown [Coraliomargarita sp. CAG:312]|nr:unknown [Coraliomargarita sp. CAG:312]
MKSCNIETCPPVGNHPVTAAKRTASSARKKYGMLRAAYARNALSLSKIEFWRTAARTPSGTDTTYITKVLASASHRVGKNLCPINSETEIL